MNVSCKMTLSVGSGVRDMHSWTLFILCGQVSVFLFYRYKARQKRHQGLNNEHTAFHFYRWYFQLKINIFQWVVGLKKVNLLPYYVSSKNMLHLDLLHAQLLEFFFEEYLISNVAGDYKTQPPLYMRVLLSLSLVCIMRGSGAPCCNHFWKL